MSAKTNVEILSKAYRLWNESKAQSVEHWFGLLDENVIWRSIADGAPGMEFSRACRNKKEVTSYFSALAEEWDMIHYTVDEFIAQGDRVVMVGSCGWRHRRTGKLVDSPKVDILRLRGGKIVEFFELYDTAQAIDAVQ